MWIHRVFAYILVTMITRERAKDLYIFFGAQFIVYYLLLTVNYSAIAKGSYLWTGLSDLVFASVNFFVIRKIATSKVTSVLEWGSYVTGSVAGSLLGIYLSKLIFGQ